MAINSVSTKLHWNYFLALESDLEVISRYIEFSPANFDTFSIELAHLLFAASSEADVVIKALCNLLDSTRTPRNINEYHPILAANAGSLIEEKVYIGRHGLTLTPWIDWGPDAPPLWWQSYNKVNHQRNDYFDRATLKHALNALSGLFVGCLYYYQKQMSITENRQVNPKDVTRAFGTPSRLMRFSEDYYNHALLTE